MSHSSPFLFVVCQRGAEAALKSEVARLWPELRFSFSRPGFVTFKSEADGGLDETFQLRATFARTCGLSRGKVAGQQAEAMARELWEQTDHAPYDQLHVWQRDAQLPGERGFEPGVTPLAQEVGQRVAECAPGGGALPINQPAGRGQRVLDVVLVEPTQWWFGSHLVTSPDSRWPGGVPPLERPDEMISRAYLKMQEALAWSKLPVAAGDWCAEIGCAPGGASQALLERGLRVLGIDPADIDPRVLADTNFHHVRKRAADMQRREFHAVKWLLADSNVAPQYTLDSVEAIVTHRDVHVRGLLLTLKLLDWKLADMIPQYVERVRGWGYSYVRTRQLAFNRREFCLAALRSRAQRRLPRRHSSHPAG